MLLCAITNITSPQALPREVELSVVPWLRGLDFGPHVSQRRQAMSIAVSSLFKLHPWTCFDGFFNVWHCCGVETHEGCWQSAEDAQTCCGRVSFLRAELAKRLAAPLELCPDSQVYVSSRFMLQHLTSMDWAPVAAEDLEERKAHRWGTREASGCSKEAMEEDEGAVVLALHDRLDMMGVGLTRRHVNLGAGQWRDPIWDLVDFRNGSGVFVDPQGPPQGPNAMKPSPRVRFLKEAAEPDTLKSLLRRGFKAQEFISVECGVWPGGSKDDATED